VVFSKDKRKIVKKDLVRKGEVRKTGEVLTRWTRRCGYELVRKKGGQCWKESLSDVWGVVKCKQLPGD